MAEAFFHMNQQYAAKYDLENTWTQNGRAVRLSSVNYHLQIVLPSDIKVILVRDC